MSPESTICCNALCSVGWLGIGVAVGTHSKSSRDGAGHGKLSGEDLHWLHEAVTLGNPQNYQFDFCLWSLRVMRSMLKRERGVTLSKSAISRLLKFLGLSPQRPLYKSYKQDPKTLDAYLKQTFPQVVAKALGAIIYFVDEAAVRSDAHRGLTWGKVGETPVVKW